MRRRNDKGARWARKKKCDARRNDGYHALVICGGGVVNDRRRDSSSAMILYDDPVSIRMMSLRSLLLTYTSSSE